MAPRRVALLFFVLYLKMLLIVSVVSGAAAILSSLLSISQLSTYPHTHAILKLQ